MKFLPLVWKNLMRRKVRTSFTMMSILVAFFLFGLLAAIRIAFSMGVDVAGADRLVSMHKLSFILPLPLSYGQRIAQLNGITQITYANWFGGVYKDPKNNFAQFAVEPTSYLRTYPEIRLPEAQKQAWLADRGGAVVGRSLADRFGFKVGDHIPIQGTIYLHKDGSRLWDFTIDGIYDAAKGFDTSGMLFQYEYLKEGIGASFSKDQVGWYITRIADPRQAQPTAERIDALFANSPAETKTQTEKAFANSFANQVGNIGTILTGILSAVFFTILLVAGNTMAQSVRERINELAVLKTLGFTNPRVMGLVLAESCLIAVSAGCIGLALAWAFASLGDPTRGKLPVFYMPARDVVLGVVLALALGLIAGLLPALQAMRLRIVDALRRI
jgi:putative ABC transport system permease protein